MDVTLFLAQFWGWLLVILGLIFLLRRKALMDVMYQLVGDKSMTMLTGYLALTIGLVTVLLHNVWVADWRVIITIFGWFSLLKGIVRIGFPDVTQKAVAPFRDNPMLVQALLVIIIVLGGWLLWMSY
ncbi:MAG: hypothetical protein AAB605_04340 [Patescibacteria group bacterium]